MFYAVSVVFNDELSVEQADQAFDNAYAMGFDVSITSNDGVLKGVTFIEDEFSFADMFDVFAEIFDTATCRSFSIVPEQDYFDEVSPNPSKILNII